MEGTWEDERWSEKGEGVSLTELIFDSLNILKAVCHTCRENFQVSSVHVTQVPAFLTEILYSTVGNLESTPEGNFSHNDCASLFFPLLFFTIQTALTKVAAKSASQLSLHLSFYTVSLAKAQKCIQQPVRQCS